MSSSLVIGDAGNLGCHLVRTLLERGCKNVKSFDLAACGEKVVSLLGNVTDVDALTHAMVGIDTVYHAASIIDIKPVPSLLMTHVNVTGTACVIAACKASGVKTLVYTASLDVVSGCDVHGRGGQFRLQSVWLALLLVAT